MRAVPMSAHRFVNLGEEMKFRNLVGFPVMAFAAVALAQTGSRSPEPDRLTPPEVQFIMILAARFYCDRSRWPTSISEMFEYRNIEKVLPKISVREDLILKADISYSYQPTFRVRAPSFVNDKPLVIEFSQVAASMHQGWRQTARGTNAHRRRRP